MFTVAPSDLVTDIGPSQPRATVGAEFVALGLASQFGDGDNAVRSAGRGRFTARGCHLADMSGPYCLASSVGVAAGRCPAIP